MKSGKPEFQSCFQLHNQLSPNIDTGDLVPLSLQINKKVKSIRKELNIYKTHSLHSTLKMTVCNNNDNYYILSINFSSLSKIQEDKFQIHVEGQRSRISKKRLKVYSMSF